ncbi:hypothetical protein AC249_AIPGENE7667 [Exaiptasia diaphana]|nr:hypothetical protein AC249_AIPGENE7667 [Exaiptasia diaphana]
MEMPIIVLQQLTWFQYPPPDKLPGCEEIVPYVAVVDEGLPMKKYQVRPYPGKHLSENEAIFNYRLSRARRIIENIFGIMAARWRIFRRPIKADVATVEKIVLACVCLHNYLRLTDNANYSPSGFIDYEDSNGNLKQGDWRKIVAQDKNGALAPFHCQSGRHSDDAKSTREVLTRYFVTEEGQVPWQWEKVRSCGPCR